MKMNLLSKAISLGTLIAVRVCLAAGNIPTPSSLALIDSVNQVDLSNLDGKPQVRNARDRAALDLNKVLRVFLDPGHGGKDLGAQSFGLTEKNLTLSITQKVKRDLERYSKLNGVPIEVRLSREEDESLSLKDRVFMANNWNADLYVSIHLNSSPVAKARGFEVYFLSPEASDPEAEKLALKENAGNALPDVKPTVLSILSDTSNNLHMQKSSEFAESVFSAISRKVLSNGRGIRQGPFTVLHGTTMPSILVEVGYLTNTSEAMNLRSENYLKRLAGAISTGILEFGSKIKKLSFNHWVKSTYAS